MSKKTEQKPKEKKIYCGPKIKSDIQPYNIFIGEPPANVKEHIEKCPEIGRLMVNIEDLAKTKERAQRKGTKENAYYEKILKYRGGK